MAEASSSSDGDVMSDEDFEAAIEKLAMSPDTEEVAALLAMMNESRLLSIEETERLMQDVGGNKVVKSGLLPTSRPSEPDNETDVEDAITRLQANDPKLTELNLNNMKRTPIPMLHRLFQAIKGNGFLRKLQLANTGLGDNAAEPLLGVLEANSSLKHLNLETNYLTGDFLAKLFKAMLVNQSLEEVKCVNQTPTFSTAAEESIIESLEANKGLCKCSINLRMPQARNLIDKFTMRNCEIR